MIILHDKDTLDGVSAAAAPGEKIIHIFRRQIFERGMIEGLTTATKELICMQGTIQQNLIELTGKPVADCTDQELYLALLNLVRRESEARRTPVSGKKLY